MLVLLFLFLHSFPPYSCVVVSGLFFKNLAMKFEMITEICVDSLLVFDRTERKYCAAVAILVSAFIFPSSCVVVSGSI